MSGFFFRQLYPLLDTMTSALDLQGLPAMRALSGDHALRWADIPFKRGSTELKHQLVTSFIELK